MLLKFNIGISLVLFAAAAIIENNETVTTDYGGSTLNAIEDDWGTTTFNITTTTERPTCNSDQWQCADGECVRKEHKCDGAFHCEDGSDEKRVNCKNSERHMMALLLYCIAERTNLKEGVCPDICETQLEYCSYAILAEQKSAPEGVCALPDFTRNGTYKISTLNTTSEFGFKDFSINFECDYGTELVGETKATCINGTWDNDFPFCSETCKLNKNPDYKYICKRGEKTKLCGDFVAIETELTVEKHDKKISNSTITARATCTRRRVFNVTSSCINESETRQDTFEKDAMNKLSDFENKFKEIKHPSFEFEELVRSYRTFEAYVAGNTTELAVEIAVCDMKLDLMDTRSTV